MQEIAMIFCDPGPNQVHEIKRKPRIIQASKVRTHRLRHVRNNFNEGMTKYFSKYDGSNKNIRIN